MMPLTTSHIPLPGRVAARMANSLYRPAFKRPVRWVLALLAWVAFGVAGYLAFNAVTGSSVAGCGVGPANGCDIVLSSSWSKWLGMPVAVLGLACYASLASLAVLLGLRNPTVNRWITTAFVLLSIVAAGASIWFIGIQVFAIGNYCKFCLVTDACGIVLGVIATVAGISAWRAGRASTLRSMSPGLVGLRPATPTSTSTASTSQTTAFIAAPPPSLLAAFGGAIPLIAALIGGQVFFASKTYTESKVTLNQAVSLDSTDETKTPAGSPSATTRVAMRVPSEAENATPGETNAAKQAPSAAPWKGDDKSATSPSNKSEPTTGSKAAPPEIPVEQPKKRLVSFLGGNLTLDVYRHPLIGSPDAPHVVVEMVSYDCPHCRKTHPLMQKALERYGDQVALLIIPIPLDKDCNSLITDPTILRPGSCGTVRQALAMARLNPTGFGRFHDFLMSGKDKKGNDAPPSMDKIITKAHTLANADKLREMSRGPEVQRQMEGYVKLFGKLREQDKSGKSLGLPVQILNDTVISGSVEKPEDVFKAWEEHLGVKPKPASL